MCSTCSSCRMWQYRSNLRCFQPTAELRLMMELTQVYSVVEFLLSTICLTHRSAGHTRHRVQTVLALGCGWALTLHPTLRASQCPVEALGSCSLSATHAPHQSGSKKGHTEGPAT